MTLDWHKVIDKDFRDSRSFIEAIDQTQGVEVCGQSFPIAAFAKDARTKPLQHGSSLVRRSIALIPLKRRLLTSAGWHENMRLSGPFISTIAPT